MTKWKIYEFKRLTKLLINKDCTIWHKSFWRREDIEAAVELKWQQQEGCRYKNIKLIKLKR